MQNLQIKNQGFRIKCKISDSTVIFGKLYLKFSKNKWVIGEINYFVPENQHHLCTNKIKVYEKVIYYHINFE